jgi:hypothetical protein
MTPASIEKVSPVVVGVTGHRILADVQPIRSGVALVLNHIEASFHGRSLQGQGGTGEIVSLARSRHLPIAWVHAGNRKPGTKEATSLGQAQGGVTLEGF